MMLHQSKTNKSDYAKITIQMQSKNVDTRKLSQTRELHQVNVSCLATFIRHVCYYKLKMKETWNNLKVYKNVEIIHFAIATASANEHNKESIHNSVYLNQRT